VFLVATGSEALYAGMGHSGSPGLPSGDPEPQHLLAPLRALYPLVALATAATASLRAVIALFDHRQAVIGLCAAHGTAHTRIGKPLPAGDRQAVLRGGGFGAASRIAYTPR
jgi:hypothetical protein